MVKLRGFSALLTVALLVTTLGVADARAPVVAHGISPHGVPWTIRASRFKKTGNLDFTVLPPGYPDAGGSSTFKLPLPNVFFISADAGSNRSPAPEGDVSGFAFRSTAKLQIRFTDGSSLEAVPSPPGARARKKAPWVKKLVFFDVFFADTLTPTAITALDANGQPLGTIQSHGGLFY